MHKILFETTLHYNYHFKHLFVAAHFMMFGSGLLFILRLVNPPIRVILEPVQLDWSDLNNAPGRLCTLSSQIQMFYNAVLYVPN